MKVLVLSDIHGNWPALQAVLNAEPDAAQIICLGDLVNYGPQPVECVVWAMRLTSPSLVIQGNHDRAFGLGTAPNCAPPFQQLAGAVQAATSHLLAPEMRRFLADSQPLQRFRLGDATCVACHTRPRDPRYSGFGKQDWQSWGESEPKPGEGPFQAFPRESARAQPESEIVLVGHPDMPFLLIGHPNLLFLGYTHTPMKTEFRGTLVVIPGSVGLPLDGDPRAAYAVWQDGEATLRRAAYDVEEAVRAFEPLTLDERIKHHLVGGLRTGGWVATYLPADTATGR
jgi:predicted phosphodiesterase